MKILITGATGLIGTSLIKLLQQNKIEIHYLTTSKHKIKNNHNFKGFYWNPSQEEIDPKSLEGVDAIIHLAGATITKRWTTNYKKEIISSRTISSNLLFRTLKNNPNQIKQLISASATGVYADSFSKIYTENETQKNHSFLANVVQNWEQNIDQFENIGIQVCKLRTGIVLAQNGGALPEMIKPIKLGLGAAFGTGKQIQSWIHVDDLTKMYWYAVQNKWNGVYNAVAPTPITNQLLTQKIASRLHKKLLLPHIPKFVMQLVLGEMCNILYDSQSVSAQKAINSGFEFEYKTIDEALTNLIP